MIPPDILNETLTEFVSLSTSVIIPIVPLQTLRFILELFKYITFASC